MDTLNNYINNGNGYMESCREQSYLKGHMQWQITFYTKYRDVSIDVLKNI